MNRLTVQEATTARTATSATFRIKNVLGLTIAADGTLTSSLIAPNAPRVLSWL